MGIEVALAAVAIGSIVGGIQQSEAATDQAKFAVRESRIADIAADKSREEAGEKVAISRRETQRFKSSQLVGFLKSGVLLQGTPLDVLAETERLGEEDVASILRGGEAEARQFQSQARGLRSQAKTARSKGRAALLGGFTSAAGSLAGGLSAQKAAGVS